MSEYDRNKDPMLRDGGYGPEPMPYVTEGHRKSVATLRSVLRQLLQRRDEWVLNQSNNPYYAAMAQECADALAPIIAEAKAALGEKT